MKYIMKTIALAAAAAIASAAPQTSGPVTGYTFDISDFVCKHAVASNYSIASFNLAGPTIISTRCYSSEMSSQEKGLAEYFERPCEDPYFTWSLARTGPNSNWVLQIYYIDIAGSYIFPPEFSTFYNGSLPFSGIEEQYEQLAVPGGTLQTL